MDLVVNEWLPEYFRPEESDENLNKVLTFLNVFMQRDDVLFVKNPSPFHDKIHRFRKQFDYDPTSRELFKNFITLILRNEEKCVLVQNEDVEKLPKQTLQKLSVGNFSSDTYLFEAAQKTESKLIITTDVKLKEQMSDDETFELVLLDDFLKDYQ